MSPYLEDVNLRANSFEEGENDMNQEGNSFEDPITLILSPIGFELGGKSQGWVTCLIIKEEGNLIL